VNALIVSDLHYVNEADHVCPLPKRRAGLALDLLGRAFDGLRADGVDPDVAIILGDVVDNGLADGAERDLAAVAEAMRAWGVPVLAVPGNHDGDPVRMAGLFGCPPGLHEVGGYGFLVFHDEVGAGDVTVRSREGLSLPGQVAAAHPDLPLVALQHNPLHPPIEREYPYLLDNADQALTSYSNSGVILSVSGHYHNGQPAHQVGDGTYLTVAALCEEPFRYVHVQLRERAAEVYERSVL
jgi:hypothetical protein